MGPGARIAAEEERASCFGQLFLRLEPQVLS